MSKLKNVTLVQVRTRSEDNYKFALTDDITEFYYSDIICNLSETHQYIPTMTEHFRTYDFDNFGFWELSKEVLYYFILNILSPIILVLYIYDKVRNQ